MRALMAAAAGLAMMGASTNPAHSASPMVLPSSPRVPREPRVDKKRPRPKTVYGRDIGRSSDPYFGIKSKGRKGARARQAKMAAAKPAAAGAHLSNPFKVESRRQAFDAALKSLEQVIRNPAARRAQAMRVARRVTA